MPDTLGDKKIAAPHRRTAQGPGAELGNALPDEDFQVLRRRERSACPQVDDVLSALRELGMATIKIYRTDGGVRLYNEGAGVGRPVA